MNAFGTLQLAALVAAAGVALALLARTRMPLLAGFALVAAAEAKLAHPSGGVSTKLVAAGLVAAFVGILLALLLSRMPSLVIPLVVAAAPFRLPLNFDVHHRFLVSTASHGQLGRLLLLYGVLGIAVLELAWRSFRLREVKRIPTVLAVPVALFLALACLSLLWTEDIPAGKNLLAFFLVPFGVLVAVVARAPMPQWLSRVLAIEAVAIAVVFALVGLWEATAHRNLFFASNLEISNAYTSYFRVTSLFRDPSLYGRHLVLGMAILLVALYMRRVGVVWGAALLAVLWAGLYFSYSQSSLLSLFAVVIAIAAVAGDRVARRAVLGLAVVAAVLAAGLVAASARNVSTQKATSDRSRRVELTARVFAHHSIAGVGIGAQPFASQKISPRPGPLPKFVSHTTPLTVAAELGILGIAAYLGVIAGAARVVDLARRAQPALGLALGAVLLALIVHSLFYSGFFEDPMTWLAMGIAANVAAQRVRTA